MCTNYRKLRTFVRHLYTEECAHREDVLSPVVSDLWDHISHQTSVEEYQGYGAPYANWAKCWSPVPTKIWEWNRTYSMTSDYIPHSYSRCFNELRHWLTRLCLSYEVPLSFDVLAVHVGGYVVGRGAVQLVGIFSW